jgi:4-hydroxy-tetrahydrodipicolinate reductase
MLAVALFGATGRMGGAILNALSAASDLRLVGALASSRSAWLGRDIGEVGDGAHPRGVIVTDDPAAALARAQVCIDFSIAEAASRHLEACIERQCALVLGVTALDDAFEARLSAAARRIPIVQSPNMSLGVNVCFSLVERAARALDNYDVEIVDIHHRHKRDAPSGTALQFGRLIDAAGARRATFSSVRTGEVVGEHTVLFADANERVEITHRTAGRAPFAAGALSAARWVVRQPPGRYGMQEVLGLTDAPSS